HEIDVRPGAEYALESRPLQHLSSIFSRPLPKRPFMPEPERMAGICPSCRDQRGPISRSDLTGTSLRTVTISPRVLPGAGFPDWHAKKFQNVPHRAKSCGRIDQARPCTGV